MHAADIIDSKACHYNKQSPIKAIFYFADR